MTCLTIRNVTCLRKGTLPKIRKCFPPILYLNLMKRLSKILLILISGAWRVSGGINLLSRVKLFWQDNWFSYDCEEYIILSEISEFYANMVASCLPLLQYREIFSLKPLTRHLNRNCLVDFLFLVSVRNSVWAGISLSLIVECHGICLLPILFPNWEVMRIYIDDEVRIPKPRTKHWNKSRMAILLQLLQNVTMLYEYPLAAWVREC